MGIVLRAAVIGAGQIAQRAHLPGYIQAGAEIVALCDTMHPDLETIASKYQVKRCYRDWQQMLADGGFDVVSICTPPFLHCQMAVEVARRGCHVLVEKPMAMTLEECDQMIEAAQKAGVLLMISHNQRFVAAHQKAKEILDSGALGKPYLVHGVFGHAGPEVWSPSQQWYFRPERAGQGVIADLGYHKLDLIRWLCSQEYVHISAFKNTFEKSTTLEDSAVCSFQLSAGTMGTLQVGWVFRPDWENSMVIRCESGVIRIPTDASDPLRVMRLEEAGRVVESEQRGSSQDSSGWLGAIHAFVDAVQAGGPSPVPGYDGRAALTAVLGAADSAAQKKIISFEKGT